MTIDNKRQGDCTIRTLLPAQNANDLAGRSFRCSDFGSDSTGFASQGFPVELELLHRERQVIPRRVDVFGTHLRIGVAQGFHQDKDIAVGGLGQTSGEGVTERVQDKFAGEFNFGLKHVRVRATLTPCITGRIPLPLWCGQPIPQFRVEIAQCRPCVVPTLQSRKYPRGIVVDGKAQFEYLLRSFSLRKGSLGIGRFATPDGDDVSVYVALPQRYRLLGPQSQVEHQDRRLLQGIRCQGQVRLLHFAGQHKVALMLTGQGTDFHVVHQLAAFGKNQRLSQHTELGIDRRNGHFLLKPRVLVGLDRQLGEFIQRQRAERFMGTQTADPFGVEAQRGGFLDVLLLFVEKRALEKGHERGRRFFLDQADAGERQVGAVCGEPSLRLFMVSEMRGLLMASLLVPKICVPHTAAFDESSAHGFRSKLRDVCSACQGLGQASQERKFIPVGTELEGIAA